MSAASRGVSTAAGADPSADAMGTTGRNLALGLMMASGFAALGYQIVWTQQSALWLGHELAAVLAVVAGFFGGLAVGAFALGARIERSASPAGWYAACEIATGAWAVALTQLMAPAADIMRALTGATPSPGWQWTVAFCGTLLLLMPATAAMGATLPAMERVIARTRSRSHAVAWLYAGNTFGALVGVLGTALWLVPRFGLTLSAWVCACLSLACAALASTLFGSRRAASCSTYGGSGRAPGLLMLLAATGLLGIGYEVLIIRVLSQLTENTVYTFAIVLAVYLVGTTAGSAAYARWASESPPPHLRGRLLWLQAVACLSCAAALAAAPALKTAILQASGFGFGRALAAEAALACVGFLLPCMIMGALFSHLASLARGVGVGLGAVLGFNTLGAAAAPAVFGVALAQAFGARLSLIVVAAGYLALSIHRVPPLALVVTATAACLLAVAGPSLTFVDVPPGGRVASHREGAMATVAVVEDAAGVARLHINNRQQEGSSATSFSDARQAVLPLLLHPGPRHVLFLGLGTGITASSAAADPKLTVDVVELLPEVVEASTYFRRHAWTDKGAERLHIITADARRFVRANTPSYDVIVSDNFHPARSGSGSLYTVENFWSIRYRLSPGGLFCQWVPLHQLDLETLRSIVGSFMTAFPRGRGLLATYSLDTPVVGLIGWRDEDGLDPALLRARLADAEALRPSQLGFDDELSVLGTFIAGSVSLAQFTSGADLNTDDRPVVAYRAPQITYAPDSAPRDRLIELLHRVSADPDELLATSPRAAWSARLVAYWAARNRFIEVGRDVRPTGDPRRMLAQVQEPLLAVLRMSPDFRPAYDPLLRMGVALGATDPIHAHTLLTELRAVQPAWPDATEALRDLGGWLASHRTQAPRRQ